MKRNLFLAALLVSTMSHVATAQLWEDLADIPEHLTFPVVSVVGNYIHIMGGGAAAGATDAHYRYNTSTDTWDTMASVPYLAQQPAGAAVNGMIHHFGGGFPNSGSPVNDHYIYNPGSDSWTQGGDLSAPRAIHYGINLNDTLYSIAGQGMKTLFERYNPADSSWASRATLPDANFWYGAHVAHGGKVYRFGGGGFTAPVSNAHVYDPTLDQWSSLSPMPGPLHAVDGGVIGDSVYLVGGYNLIGQTDVWIYDIAMDTYTAGPELPKKRYYHSVVGIGSCIYAVGGTSGSPFDSIETSLQRYCLGNMPSGTSTRQARQLILGQDANNITLVPDAAGEVNVFNIMGVQVAQAVLVAGQLLRVPTTQLPGGIYMVTYRSEHAIQATKFVVSH